MSSAVRIRRPARHNPLGWLAGDFGDAVVIGVVVQDDKREAFRGRRHDQIRYRHRPVLTSVGEFPLDLDRSAGNLVGHREILECLALGTEMIVLLTVARAVQDFQVDDRARRDQAAIDVRRDDRLHPRLREPGPYALVDQIACYRHAESMTSGSARSGSAPPASSPRCLRRNSAATTRRSASLTVAFFVVVPRIAAAWASSSWSSSSCVVDIRRSSRCPYYNIIIVH